MKHTTGRGPKKKGRGYENEIVDSILAAFPRLSPADVTARAMGDIGVDILLSEAARKVLPLAIECKRVGRVENLNLAAALLQAQQNTAQGVVSVVVYREDRHHSIAALWLADLAFLAGYIGDANVDASVITSLWWTDLLKILGGTN